jgi:hypothetical protein
MNIWNHRGVAKVHSIGRRGRASDIIAWANNLGRFLK